MIAFTQWNKCARLSLSVAVFLLIGAGTPAQLSRPSQTPPLQYSPQLVSEIRKIQQAALGSDYAYRELAHLANNIGPRLSGSLQAQAAVEYVAGELRKLGLEVKLEKVMVPHWVRGEETAALTEYPSMAPGTNQKIVLTALGGSVATPNDGLTAEVVVVNDFDQLQALGRKGVAGKNRFFHWEVDQRTTYKGFAGVGYRSAVVLSRHCGGTAAPPGRGARSKSLLLRGRA